MKKRDEKGKLGRFLSVPSFCIGGQGQAFIVAPPELAGCISVQAQAAQNQRSTKIKIKIELRLVDKLVYVSVRSSLSRGCVECRAVAIVLVLQLLTQTCGIPLRNFFLSCGHVEHHVATRGIVFSPGYVRGMIPWNLTAGGCCGAPASRVRHQHRGN